MTLERLRCFVAVAKQLNFTKAAKECHIAQTAMSRQIAMLEEEVDCRLLYRDNRTVSLTPAGKAFYEGSVVMLELYRETTEKAQAAKLGMAGTLRVGIGQYERNFVSELVGEFHSKYPNIEVSVSQYHYKDLVDHIKNGTVDVIFALPISAEYMVGQNVDIQELFSSKLSVIVNRDHPFSEQACVTRTDMASQASITISEDAGPCSLENYQKKGRENGIFHMKIIQANSLEAEFLMIEAGMGVAVGPHFLKEELPPKLTMVPLESGFYPIGKFVCMIRSDNQNPAAHIFVAGIKTSRTLWSRLERDEKGTS